MYRISGMTNIKKQTGGYYECEVDGTTSRLLPMRFLHADCTLMSYYAAISGKSFNDVSVEPSGSVPSFKMGPIGFP
jgi:hypothetical protein